MSSSTQDKLAQARAAAKKLGEIDSPEKPGATADAIATESAAPDEIAQDVVAVKLEPPFACLPVGANCIWYHGADRSGQPYVAVVTDVSNGGTLKMRLLETGQTKSAVCHVDSPVLAKNPNLKQTHGGWDYVPAMPKPDPQELAEWLIKQGRMRDPRLPAEVKKPMPGYSKSSV